MKRVDNTTFTQARDNEDNKRLIESVLFRYRKVLSSNTLDTCKDVGLWLALARYDDSRCKFTTYLHKSVNWQCQRALLKKKRHSQEQSLNIDQPDRDNRL